MTEKKLIRRLGRATFEKRASFEPTADDLALIAKQVPEGWPAPTAADVYVASALVCNNLVDHYSTQFTDRSLEQIVQLIVGANVMRNHNEFGSGDLPIARCFAAAVVIIDGAKYVRAWFYWERGTDQGDRQARMVALGLWREVSLSWWMRSFTNSIDGKPFDESPYYAGQEMPDGTIVIGIMDDVVEVTEFSFVARGGQKNTSINPAERAGAEEPEDVLKLVHASRARAKAKPPEPSGWERWFPRGSAA